MKRIIYIDFENVSTAGLNGILDLNEKDHVKIFLGPKCSKLSLIEAEAILHCHATVELITNDQIGKNALDFIIMVHMGYDIAKKAGKAFYIISNDKGYEPAIHEMQSMTGLTIERLSDIRQVLNEEEPAKGGLFGLFGKKHKQVQNMTEHEVYEKGKRVGQAKRSTRPDAENRNNGGGDRQRNGRRNSGGDGARNRSAQNRSAQNRNNSERNSGGQTKNGASQKPGNASRAGRQNTAAKPEASGKQEPQTKRDGQEKLSAEPVARESQPVSRESQPVVRESQPVSRESQPNRERRAARRSTRKEAELRNPEDLSVAELAKQLGIERPQKAAEPDAALETRASVEPKSAAEPGSPAAEKSAEEPKAAAKTEMPAPSPEAAASAQGHGMENVRVPGDTAEGSVTSLVEVPEPIVNVPAVTAPVLPVKKERAKRPAPMNAEEKALVARAMEANEDKEAYHNYLMAELHDTQRATELYKLSKNRFLKAKENAKSTALKAEDEKKTEQEAAALLAAEALRLAAEEQDRTLAKKWKYSESTRVEQQTSSKKTVAMEMTESVVGEPETVKVAADAPVEKSEVPAQKPQAVKPAAEEPVEKAEAERTVEEVPVQKPESAKPAMEASIEMPEAAKPEAAISFSERIEIETESGAAEESYEMDLTM